MLRFTALVLAGLITMGSASGQIVNKLYVPHGGGSLATTVYGIESGELINQVGANFEIGLAVSNADSTEVWLFGDHSSYCNVIDAVSDRLMRTFDASLIASRATFSPDGKYCFAIGRTNDKPGSILMAIDRGTYEALYSIGGFSEPVAAVVTPDSKFLYIAARLDGVVAKVAIPSFQVVKLISVGPEPIDLQLSADGRLLFVACMGLDGGRRGGSQLVLIDLITDRPTWIANDIGKAPQSLTLNSESSRVVMSYAESQKQPQANLRIFHVEQAAGEYSFVPGGGTLHGRSPGNGVIVGDGATWIGTDQDAGMVWMDLTSEGTKPVPVSLVSARPVGVAAIRLDVGARISELQARMSLSSDNTEIADSYLDLAYLYSTSGNKNEVVATYNKVISTYPSSLAAITAGLRMSEIAFNQGLTSQSADYGVTALQSYAEYLMNSDDKRVPPQFDLLAALDRVAAYAKEAKRDFLEQLAERMLKISAQNSTLAELYFNMGYHLQLQDNSKLAKRCFLESRNQIGAMQDRLAMLTLSAKLALANGDQEAELKVRDRRETIVIDGLMEEWQKTKALSLSGDGGYVYGPALWTGVNDLSASLYLAVTKTDLIIAGTILDNSLVSFSTGQGDGINFYLDLRPESSSLFTRRSDFGEGCFTISIDAPAGNIPKARLRLSTQAEYEIGSEATAAGYSFEARIPLTAFGQYYNTRTKRFGFGVEILDFDSSGNPSSMKALGFLLPTRDPGAAPDPLLFGIAER